MTTIKFYVTRTYNGNCDILKTFTKLSEASEYYYHTRRITGNDARIELEEIK